MTSRTSRRALALGLGLLTAVHLGCEPAGGSPLTGGQWTPQPPHPAQWFHPVFDSRGHISSQGYSYDPEVEEWTRLSGNGIGLNEPTLDLEGKLHSIKRIDHVNNTVDFFLYRLEAGAWSEVYPLPAGTSFIAWGKGGTLFTAGWVPNQTNVYRRTGSGFELMLQLPEYLKDFFNDPLGNVYLTSNGATQGVSEAGDALFKLFDCAGPTIRPYCGELHGFALSPAKELIFDTGTYFRVASPTGKPEPFAERDKVYWIVNHTVFQRGNIFVNAKKVSGENPSLIRLGWGEKEFKEVLEMPCYGCVPLVRDDGAIFAFEGSGALWRLTRIP
jgi:hypothetical protein